MASSKPDYLPEAASPIAITLGVRALAHGQINWVGRGRGKHSVYAAGPLIIFKDVKYSKKFKNL